MGSTLNSRVSARTGKSGQLPAWGLGAAAVAIVGLALMPPAPWLITAAVSSVSMNDGQMQLTRIFSCPWSMAMHLVRRTTAPFDAA